MKINRSVGLLAAITLLLAVTAMASAQPLQPLQPLQPRSSEAAGVNVTVKPLGLTADAKTWDFEIKMETHTKPLEQDLVRVSVLVDDGGKQYTPSAWKGDPPGGHHRKGVLQFAPVPGSPNSLELRITGIGAPDARVFAWKLR
jgi:hypothetical protein